MSISEKIERLSPGLKASIAFFFASVITKGVLYFTTPLYTRLLSATEYGQVSVFMTWVQLFGFIAMFCLSQGVFNNGMTDYPSQRSEYSFSMLVLSNIITICFMLVLLCVYPFIKQWLGLDIPLVLLMGAIFLFQPAYSFWSARQRYELKYKTNVLWSVVIAIISPLVAIICLIKTDDNRLYARIFGAEIPMIIIYMGFYIYHIRKSRGKVDTSFWKAAVLFNLPLIPHYLSGYLLGSSDKLMISALVNDSAVAYYSVAYSVASVANIVWSAVNGSLIPYTYENCKKKNYRAISNIVNPILTLFAAVCVLVIMFAPEVVAFMATADYTEAVYVIPPVVGGVFFQVQYYLYANILYYYKKPKYVMIGSITATILNLVLNYIFIRIFGYIAAGYTTIFCYFVNVSIDYFAMSKVMKEPIYNMRYIGMLSLSVAVIAVFANLIYDYRLIRYIVICVLFVFCVVFRKKIINIFKSIKGKQQN